VQLAARSGATVIGLASERNHPWLRARGVVPVAYGAGQAERIRDAAGGQVNAFMDTFGSGYVDLAIELGVPVERINTIIDYAAVERLGVHGEGTHSIATSELLGEIVALVADGSLDVPIARTFALGDVREAFTARSCSCPSSEDRLSSRRVLRLTRPGPASARADPRPASVRAPAVWSPIAGGVDVQKVSTFHDRLRRSSELQSAS
jgi:hypothetical protein